MTDPFLDTEAVSAQTLTPVGTLRYWRHRGIGPESFKLGRRVVYRQSAVDAWIESQQAATARGGAA